jgi:hypothetical protein
MLLFGDPPQGMAKYIVAGTGGALKIGAICCLRYVLEKQENHDFLKRSRSQESL